MMKTHAQQAQEWLRLAQDARAGEAGEAIGFAQVEATLAIAAELHLIRSRMEAGER